MTAEVGLAGLMLPRVLRLAIAGALVATFALAALLVVFAHPSGDDFCNVANAERWGVLGTAWHQYFHWAGRWGSDLVVVAFPAMLDITRWYPLGPALVAVVAVLSLHTLLVAVLDFRGDRRRSWSFALVLFALYLTGMPHPGQTVYWFEGAVVYSLDVSMCLFVLAGLLRLPVESGSRQRLVVAGLAVLAFWTAAFNELVTLAFLGVVGTGMLLAGLTRDPRWRAWLAIALAAGVGFASVVLAPGNQEREAVVLSGERSLAGAAALTVQMWLSVFDVPVIRGAAMGRLSPLGWVLDARLLAATVLFVGSDVPVRATAWFRRHGRVLGVVAPALVVVILTGGFVAGAWAASRPLPMRALNALYLVFLLGWFVTILALSGQLRWGGLPSPALRTLHATSALLLVLGLVLSTPFKHGIHDLVTGRIAALDREMTRRYEIARRSHALGGSREMLLHPVEPWPSSYFRNDVDRLKPNGLRCAERFLGADSLRFVTDRERPRGAPRPSGAALPREERGAGS
jgi:hypothetical protein